ncbi:MAG: DUF1232 domain-containing protein [Gammaproteobacteria bacterium]
MPTFFGTPRGDAGRAGSLKRWARGLESQLVAIAFAARDPRVPRATRLLVLLVVAYALSPIDLIPDFIPVIGLLDDLVLVPLGLALAIRLIPAGVWADCRARAAQEHIRLTLSSTARNCMIGAWCVLLAGLAGWLWLVVAH